MGKYSDMAAERAKARPAEEAAAKARRAESRAAYESSGAAKQLRRAAAASSMPKPATAPTASPGSLSGDAKAALEADLGITQPRPFDRAVQGRSFGLRK